MVWWSRRAARHVRAAQLVRPMQGLVRSGRRSHLRRTGDRWLCSECQRRRAEQLELATGMQAGRFRGGTRVPHVLFTGFRLEISRPTSSCLPSGPSETFSGHAGQEAGFSGNVPVTPVCAREESHALVPNAYPLAGVSSPPQHRRPRPLRAQVSRCPTLASARIARCPRADPLALLRTFR